MHVFTQGAGKIIAWIKGLTFASHALDTVNAKKSLPC